MTAKTHNASEQWERSPDGAQPEVADRERVAAESVGLRGRDIKWRGNQQAQSVLERASRDQEVFAGEHGEPMDGDIAGELASISAEVVIARQDLDRAIERGEDVPMPGEVDRRFYKEGDRVEQYQQLSVEEALIHSRPSREHRGSIEVQTSMKEVKDGRVELEFNNDKTTVAFESTDGNGLMQKISRHLIAAGHTRPFERLNNYTFVCRSLNGIRLEIQVFDTQPAKVMVSSIADRTQWRPAMVQDLRDIGLGDLLAHGSSPDKKETVH